MAVPIAKISPPRLMEVMPRERLFQLLDKSSERPVIWVSAPPGAGKTTLLASWINSRKLPVLWYRMDAGDGDLATFFYYLGQAVKQAAPRYRKPLPFFTPEYQFGIPVFSKRFFESLFCRVKPPVVMVFDDYQEVSPDSPLHAALCHGLEAVPMGVTVVLVSREAPVASMVRQMAGGGMAILGWDDLRLTLDETKGLADLHSRKEQSGQLLRQLHEKADGWAAGIVLLLAGAKSGSADLTQFAPPHQQIFDYFAGELFAKADGEMTKFLLATAFLPSMTAAMAERLSGVASSGKILSYLCGNHYFTEMLVKNIPVYRYHHLFREFLLSRARESFPPEELCRIQRGAAMLLEEAGRFEDAAALLRDAREWTELVRLVLAHASYLMNHGRVGTLEEWLKGIPGEIVEDTPWLLYWMGACRLPYAPAESRLLFERAFLHFQGTGDAAAGWNGIVLAWAAIVDTYVYEWNVFTSLDFWIRRMEELMAHERGAASPETDARLVSAMACALLWRHPQHADLPEWIERSLVCAEKLEQPALRVQACFNAANYYLWIEDLARAGMVTEELGKLASLDSAPPLTVVGWKWSRAALENCTSPFDGSSVATVEEGLAYADETGVHLWDHMFFAQGVHGSLNLGDIAGGEQYLKRLEETLHPRRRHSYCQFHYLSSWLAFLKNDLNLAVIHAEKAVHLADETGFKLPVILCRLALAQGRFETEDVVNARLELDIATERAAMAGSDYLTYMCLIVEAYFALCRQEGDAAAGPLQKAMAIGRKQGYTTMFWWWRPSVMGRICGKALEAGIETEYVRDLIRKRRLEPDAPHLHMENWPWPLQITTLGRFELLKDGQPVVSTGKMQKKPLELLKALIALGGRDVREELVSDLLWPDGDGDQAHKAFEVNLVRLRRLLGHEGVLNLREGRLTLNWKQCPVDVWALEEALDQAETMWNNDCAITPETERITGKVFGLYKGHFLASETEYSWAISIRERLRSKFLLFVVRMARFLEGGGQPERAVDCYLKGLEVDDLEEEFYHGLMVCYGKLGRTAKALNTYNRCRTVLAARLGIKPSPKTDSMFQALHNSHSH